MSVRSGLVAILWATMLSASAWAEPIRESGPFSGVSENAAMRAAYPRYLLEKDPFVGMEMQPAQSLVSVIGWPEDESETLVMLVNLDAVVPACPSCKARYELLLMGLQNGRPKLLSRLPFTARGDDDLMSGLGESDDEGSGALGSFEDSPYLSVDINGLTVDRTLLVEVEKNRLVLRGDFVVGFDGPDVGEVDDALSYEASMELIDQEKGPPQVRLARTYANGAVEVELHTQQKGRYVRTKKTRMTKEQWEAIVAAEEAEASAEESSDGE